jgi:hypothetical protein
MSTHNLDPTVAPAAAPGKEPSYPGEGDLTDSR